MGGGFPREVSGVLINCHLNMCAVHIDVGASRTHTHEGQGSDGEERSVRYDVFEPRSSTAHLPSPRLFCTATRSYAQRSYGQRRYA